MPAPVAAIIIAVGSALMLASPTLWVVTGLPTNVHPSDDFFFTCIFVGCIGLAISGALVPILWTKPGRVRRAYAITKHQVLVVHADCRDREAVRDSSVTSVSMGVVEWVCAVDGNTVSFRVTPPSCKARGAYESDGAAHGAAAAADHVEFSGPGRGHRVTFDCLKDTAPVFALLRSITRGAPEEAKRKALARLQGADPATNTRGGEDSDSSDTALVIATAVDVDVEARPLLRVRQPRR